MVLNMVKMIFEKFSSLIKMIINKFLKARQDKEGLFVISCRDTKEGRRVEKYIRKQFPNNQVNREWENTLYNMNFVSVRLNKGQSPDDHLCIERETVVITQPRIVALYERLGLDLSLTCIKVYIPN
jgi:hypothetical protein